MEATRKVVIVEDFQSADAPASSALLKLVEEPPRSTIFVLLANDVPPHQATIESRCLRIDFLPVSAEAIAGVLVAEELRFGFATLAARYREMVVASVGGEVALKAVDHLNHSTDALIRNPNEALLLQALLLKLSPLGQPELAGNAVDPLR